MGVDIVTGLAAASLLAAAVCMSVVPVVHRATRWSPGHVRTLATGSAVAATLWALAHAFALTASTLPEQETWAVIGIAVGAPLVTCWFALVYRECCTRRRLGRRAVALLAIEPTITALGVVSGSELFVAGRQFPATGSGTLAVLLPGTGLRLHALYTAGLAIGGVALLAREARNGRSGTRTRAGLLAVAALVPGVTWGVWLLDFDGALAYDYTPIALGVSAVCVHVATRRYGLFGSLSTARNAVFDGLRDAVVVVDDRGSLTDANPAAREAFDLDDDDLGRDASELLPDGVPVVCPDHESRTVTVTVEGEQRFLEPQWRALPHSGGGTVVSFRDVTERTRVERRYRAYVEHSHDVVVVTDADGVLEYVSPAVEHVLGKDPERVGGSALTDHIHPDDRRGVAASFAESLDSPGEAVRVTFRARHADGGWRTLEGVGVNGFEDPNIGGFLVTLRDTTTRNRYDQRLRVLTRVLRHDLRNELNVVMGYADALAESEPEPIASKGTTIRRAAVRLAELGERVRGVDRTLRDADHGGRPVYVDEVVESVAELAAEQYPNATVTTDVPDGIAAYADDLLATALWNVVENGIVHNDGDTPTVSVAVREEAGTVELTVRDDGPGIPASERTAIESGRETQLEHASGLGLWLVRWVLDGVDGELRFTDAGAGGTVVLRLRAADPAEAERVGTSTPADWAGAGTPSYTDGRRVGENGSRGGAD
ncbi:PAS domain S-box protein [Halorarum halophilum]|uniref:histidine kinase n=1 Tax=Halorarum halophilum TaxID=2743090 RepID=A0A7D5GZH9_9EURY|nr:histidine kinase N-terminal 7TM domain-containing protein [Halobaculum halophilum]QLG27513.1 PAS domain S-box protein [Halobaculum halophilum]